MNLTGKHHIQDYLQFRLPKPTYDNNELIEQVYVLCSKGIQIVVRPKKQNGVIVPCQCLSVSPHLVSRITGRGVVVDFTDSKAVAYKRHTLYNDYQILCDFQ